VKLLKTDTISEVKKKLDSYFGQASEGCGEAGGMEDMPLFQAINRYLAEDIVSTEDIPAFTRAVVDGYAVMAKDTFGVSDSTPVFLEVAGKVDMGCASDIELKPGQAVYVPTGGMLPKGADSMVMIEYVEALDEKMIAINKATAPNSGLMNKGDDFKVGQKIYDKGHQIKVKDIGMLAALGYGMVKVFTQPTVSIISTGDEIVSVFEEPGLGQIRDINSYTLAALIEQTGAKVGGISLVRDIEGELKKASKDALDRSDIVLISGGSSAGNKDLTAAVIESLGEPGVITHGIAMKPGKPTIIGVLKDEHCCCCNRSKLVVGLPGHPMAAIIVYRAIVDYFIKKYYFKTTDKNITLMAQMAENLHAGEGRETFTLIKLQKEAGNWVAEPIHAKSGSISQMRYADGFVKMSDLSEGINQGDMVEVTLFV
jgi:molybdopterin molybdotransferase